MTKDTTIIEIKLTTTNFFTRWPCHVCGGNTEKVEVLAESECGLRVCERCLEAGNIDEQLGRYAANLERHATETRALIGRLRVPSFGEYSNFSERVDVARYAGYCSEESQTEYDRVLADDSAFAKWRGRLAEEHAANQDAANQEHVADDADLLPF